MARKSSRRVLLTLAKQTERLPDPLYDFIVAQLRGIVHWLRRRFPPSDV